MEKKAVYLDRSKPIEQRVKDLLKRMTLEEKVHQLFTICDTNAIFEDGKFSAEKAKKVLSKGIGQLATVTRGFDPRTSAERANEIQKFLVESTRLKIPAIIHDECLHGCVARGSASFPQSIALASTWDPELVEKVGSAIGKETRARGIHQCLSPTINIARDPRCGRTEETYGEDPYLASRMAVAFIRGVQGEKVVCTPKHFAANFVGDGGRDSNAIHFSERILREIYFPAFKAAVMEASALSIMAAYNSIDGIPCSCNEWLLTEVLRKEWGFKGFVVSDYGSVAHIYELHKVAESKDEAAIKALKAGLDLEFPDINCYRNLAKLVKSGKLPIRYIDQAVSRVLYVKFWLGLFENPYCDPEYAEKICDSPEHRELALKAAQEGIVLLKNEGILPLKKDIKSIAVIGPNASQGRLGGYSGFGIKVVSPLEGIKNKVSKNTNVYFAEGCRVVGGTKDGFKEAIEAAKKSDVAIMCMGNLADWTGNSERTEGEQLDRCNLDLPGYQEELIKEVCNTGTPVVVVLINGSAITMTKWINDVKAIVEAWYPGEEGGNAIADVLFGDYNPGGKLPITFPKFTGQLPLYYNYKPSGRVYDYVDLRGEQELFPFGYGLSYTKFQYSNLQVTPKKITKAALQKSKIKVSVEVQNVGKYKGDEVVQLYIHDVYASTSRPVKELKRFKRITLDVNEKKKVEFELLAEDLALLDENMKPVVEPGEFEVMVGGNSKDVLKESFWVVK